jgi:two-component system, NarL family, nitrate/nitrite response regulator NarL
LDRAPAIINVLIVDESDFSRACMVAGLESSPELMIESCADVAGYEAGSLPNLVLFQISGLAIDMPKLAKQLALAAMRWPQAAALVVSDHIGGAEITAAIRAGAQGLLTSDASVECIRSAILLLVNEIGVYPVALADLLRPETSNVRPALAAPSLPLESSRLTTLTKRQGEVVQLLALGFSNRAIAERLEISESTVKVHIRAIMAQNGASNRTQIVAHFLKSTPQ